MRIVTAWLDTQGSIFLATYSAHLYHQRIKINLRDSDIVSVASRYT